MIVFIVVFYIFIVVVKEIKKELNGVKRR